jgi:hypothetical protein
MLPHFATRLNDINESNCEDYFFLACIIFLLSLCWVAHHETLERPTNPQDAAQSFVFLKGITGVLKFRPIQQWRQSGPVSQLLRPSFIVWPPPVEGKFLVRLDKVTAMARQLPLSAEVINPQTACILALESLRVTYAYCKTREGGPGSVWGWPIYLPDLFIEMLSQGHSTALIILAYFAVLDRPFEYRTWASHGWSNDAINMVEQHLDRASLAWIQWPKRSILEKKGVDDMESCD